MARGRQGTCRKVAAAQTRHLEHSGSSNPNPSSRDRLAVDTLERGLSLIRSIETGDSSVSPSQTLAATTHRFFPRVTNRTPLFLQQQPALSSSYGIGFCACNTCQQIVK